jgi:antirestriction protein ArdC
MSEDHAIANWITVLKNDERAIFTAALACAARGGLPDECRSPPP